MQITSSSPITLRVPYQDAGGMPLVPTYLSWILYDEDDAQIADGAQELDTGTQAQVVIAGEHNVIDDVRGARRFEAKITDPTGIFTVEQFYTIAKANGLVMMQNSFMTYAGALMVRDGLGMPLDGWDAADQNRRTAALETAFVKLARLSYKIAPLDPTIYASFEDDYLYGVVNYDWVINDIRSMSLTQLKTLNPRFPESLQRAQIIEANSMLGGDTIESKRRDGIMSETIGESSMMFASRPALRLPICRDAWSEIARYTYRAVMTVRG